MPYGTPFSLATVRSSALQRESLRLLVNTSEAAALDAAQENADGGGDDAARERDVGGSTEQEDPRWRRCCPEGTLALILLEKALKRAGARPTPFNIHRYVARR
jgi:hypothetical protein